MKFFIKLSNAKSSIVKIEDVTVSQLTHVLCKNISMWCLLLSYPWLAASWPKICPDAECYANVGTTNPEQPGETNDWLERKEKTLLCSVTAHIITQRF
jgi:hypothetical protein